MASGKQLAAQNVEKFKAWCIERSKSGDWKDYVRRDLLSRTDIAAECCFATSVLRQNPTVRAELQTLENELREAGILPNLETQDRSNGKPEAADGAVDNRIVTINNRTEKRLKALEEQNAALLAEVRELRQQLKRYHAIENHLAETGRMVRP